MRTFRLRAVGVLITTLLLPLGSACQGSGQAQPTATPAATAAPVTSSSPAAAATSSSPAAPAAVLRGGQQLSLRVTLGELPTS